MWIRSRFLKHVFYFQWINEVGVECGFVGMTGIWEMEAPGILKFLEFLLWVCHVCLNILNGDAWYHFIFESFFDGGAWYFDLCYLTKFSIEMETPGTSGYVIFFKLFFHGCAWYFRNSMSRLPPKIWIIWIFIMETPGPFFIEINKLHTFLVSSSSRCFYSRHWRLSRTLEFLT